MGHINTQLPLSLSNRGSVYGASREPCGSWRLQGKGPTVSAHTKERADASREMDVCLPDSLKC